MKKEEYAHYIASLAQRAILYEVSATPKPGLVDRYNSGSHRDMDFFTFMASSSALYRGLYECTIIGLNFEDEDKTKLLEEIRPAGIECERDMFKATEGVNTHKGIIFSMGILCAVVGHLYRKTKREYFSAEELCLEAKNVGKGLVNKDFKNINLKKELTHGERLYINYGFKGIRGEVEGGFETVMNRGIPILRRWRDNKDLSKNDLFLEILLNLMVDSEDTNVVIRGGVDSLSYVKALSEDFVASGGMKSSDAMEKLNKMNEMFVEKHISPGGAADLLAVTIFLGMIEGICL